MPSASSRSITGCGAARKHRCEDVGGRWCAAVEQGDEAGVLDRFGELRSDRSSSPMKSHNGASGTVVVVVTCVVVVRRRRRRQRRRRRRRRGRRRRQRGRRRGRASSSSCVVVVGGSRGRRRRGRGRRRRQRGGRRRRSWWSSSVVEVVVVDVVVVVGGTVVVVDVVVVVVVVVDVVVVGLGRRRSSGGRRGSSSSSARSSSRLGRRRLGRRRLRRRRVGSSTWSTSSTSSTSTRSTSSTSSRSTWSWSSSAAPRSALHDAGGRARSTMLGRSPRRGELVGARRQRELDADHQPVAVPEDHAGLRSTRSGGGAHAGEVAADAGRLHPGGPADAEAPGDAVEVQPDVIDGRDVEGEQPNPDGPVGRRCGHAAHDGDAIADIGLQLRIDGRERVPRLDRNRDRSRARRSPAAASPAGTAARRRERPIRPAAAGCRRRSRRGFARASSTSNCACAVAGRAAAHPTATNTAAVTDDRDSAPPAPQPTTLRHRQIPKRRPRPGTGDADRVDPVTHLEVDDRGLGQRAIAPVHREDVAEVDEGDLQARRPACPAGRAGSIPWRATGRRRRTARGRPRWPSPPSSPSGRGSRCTRVDGAVVHPPVRLDVEDVEHLADPRCRGSHGPQPAREQPSSNVDVDRRRRSSSAEGTRPSCRTPSRRRTPARRGGRRRSSAAIASAEHTGAGCVTTASELITVGTAAVSAAPAVDVVDSGSAALPGSAR